jgi:hypothetical protein
MVATTNKKKTNRNRRTTATNPVSFSLRIHLLWPYINCAIQREKKKHVTMENVETKTYAQCVCGCGLPNDETNRQKESPYVYLHVDVTFIKHWIIDMRTIAAESKWSCKITWNDRRESCENPLPIVPNHLSLLIRAQRKIVPSRSQKTEILVIANSQPNRILFPWWIAVCNYPSRSKEDWIL